MVWSGSIFTPYNPTHFGSGYFGLFNPLGWGIRVGLTINPLVFFKNNFNRFYALKSKNSRKKNYYKNYYNYLKIINLFLLFLVFFYIIYSILG